MGDSFQCKKKTYLGFVVMDKKVGERNNRENDQVTGNTSYALIEVNVASDAGPFKVTSDKKEIILVY